MGKTKLENRLKGWHRHFKGRFLLLKDKVLDDREFLLWDLSFSSLADWDKQHEDTYGSFDYTWQQIGYFLGWEKSKVCRTAKKLFSLKLWKRSEDGRIYLTGYRILENLTEITRINKIVDIKQFIADIQDDNAKIPQEVATLKSDFSKEIDPPQAQTVAKMEHNTPKAPLGSYKDNSVSLRSDKEYEDMWKDMGRPDDFTPDDMKFIDNSLTEKGGLKP
ncbi:hypothetical protein A2892_04250 [Candidatus Woesebacteria bacterium RIFCSPLOWO2_01_FULL_39_10b]|uniref:Uncharacterized protein n=1 Tax=Candidatus Woesebacteria bacterium RIFCSPLOWO2_01_FULL_39_10b TaxID=1802517 RepID=A0A1F8B858_9BACT|nr:MAG: hypothetical protein A2892_04250 [Candidatus Woesebacteria bacterium RIFCSPLOWO2_01_FULL_39_10b]